MLTFALYWIALGAVGCLPSLAIIDRLDPDLMDSQAVAKLYRELLYAPRHALLVAVVIGHILGGPFATALSVWTYLSLRRFFR